MGNEFENNNMPGMMRADMRERMVGEISRTFLVGDGVHEKDVSAQLKDGILSIIIVRSEKAVEGQSIKLIDIQNVIAL